MAFTASLLLCATNSQAQDALSLQDDYGTMLRTRQTVEPLGEDAFGDRTDLYTGSTRFVVTPVSIPGSNHLDVGVTLAYEASDDSNKGRYLRLEIVRPHLEGIFAEGTGWVDGNGTGLRCSHSNAPAEPPAVPNTSGKPETFEAREYWHGIDLVMPGGRSALLAPGAGAPIPGTGGPYYWVTKDNWAFSCTPMGAGEEGFVAHSPDGILYYFDGGIYLEGAADALKKPQEMGGGLSVLQRDIVGLKLRRAEDRFGNYVDYVDTANGWSIQSNDGRRIDIVDTGAGYDIIANGRTWSVSVTGPASGIAPYPNATVAYPDGSTWRISGSTDINRNYNVSTSCTHQASHYLGGGTQVTVTTPSGAVGNFSLGIVRRGLSHVADGCYHDAVNDVSANLNPYEFDQLALLSRSTSGPGMQPRTWTYSYGPANACYEGLDCTANSPVTRTVEVAGGGKYVRYVFGNRSDQTDGQLLETYEGSSSSDIKRTTLSEYMVFAARGYIPSNDQDQFNATTPSALENRTIQQDGMSFRWHVTAFDAFARPTQVTRSSQP